MLTSDIEKSVLSLIMESPDALKAADISRRLGLIEDGKFPLTAGALANLHRKGLAYVRFGKWRASHAATQS